jgi:lysophospholipase L1-like esterase
VKIFMKLFNRQAISGRVPSRIVPGVALAGFLLVIPPAVFAQGGKTGGHWIGTWTSAPVARQPTGSQASQRRAAQQYSELNFNNQTLRQIVHVSLGGERIRVVFTNVFGTAPLAIGAAHIALRDKGAAIVPASGRVLTFGGNPTTTMAAGAVAVSDPVNLNVSPLADLAIDVYLPGDTSATMSPLTVHAAAWQTNYVSAPGNHAGTADMPVQTTTSYVRADGLQSSSWFFLSRVEVMAPERVGALVTFGDSISDGTHSTQDTNNRWPDHLARRLVSQNVKMAVLNAGIGGNRLLDDGPSVSGLARFDRDVLVQTGATRVVVLLGINDIGNARQSPSPSAADLIAGHKQLIERAHALGLKIYGATLTPFEGANYWTPEGEAKRKALNEWIRTSKAYDGMIDFDAVARDPSHPARCLPRYDPGDHLHLNAAGYQAMANAIDLELLKTKTGLVSSAAR